MKLTVTFIFGICLVLNSACAQDYETCEEDEHQMNPPECPDHEDGLPTYFPYPYDCTKYFECTNGVAKCIQCPNGTVWDQKLTVCNHELVIPCNIITTIRTTPTTTTTTTTTTTPTTTTPTTTTPTTTTPTTTTPTTTTPTTTTTTTTTEPPTSDDPATWICPEGYLGPIGHPYTCRQFYICDPGRRPCLIDCPGELFYNPETEECDWPFNVPSCQDGTPPPLTSTTSRPSSMINYRTVKRFHFLENLPFASLFTSSRSKRQIENPCDEPHFRYI